MVMKAMLASDLRKQDNQELLKMVSDLKHELMNLRFQRSSSQLEKPSQFRVVRRNIARVKTVLIENKLNEEK
jgi:large subunit ribosomal protein L29